MRSKLARLALVMSLLGLVTLGLGSAVLALETRSGEQITVGKDEVINDDLVAGGTTVVVDGTINGDLLAFGRDVIINGTVNGSVATAAQSITVNGKVSGSVYAASSVLILGANASIGRNLCYGGYALQAQSGSVIQRDLLIGGYQAVLDGDVGRDVKASLGALKLDGKAGGDVQVEVGQPGTSGGSYMPMYGNLGVQTLSPGLQVSSGAQIGGKLIYTSPAEQASAITAAPAGGVEYHPSPAEGRAAPANAGVVLLRWLGGRVRDLITLLVLGALALWLFPAISERVTEFARTRPVPALGRGALVAIIGYVGAFVVFVALLVLGIFLAVITLGGLSGLVFGVGLSGLALGLAIFSFLVSFVSKLVVAYVAGGLIAKQLGPRAAESRGWALVIGVVLYVILSGIPVIGWLIALVVTLVGLGAMWIAYRERATVVTTPTQASA